MKKDKGKQGYSGRLFYSAVSRKRWQKSVPKNGCDESGCLS